MRLVLPVEHFLRWRQPLRARRLAAVFDLGQVQPATVGQHAIREPAANVRCIRYQHAKVAPCSEYLSLIRVNAAGVVSQGLALRFFLGKCSGQSIEYQKNLAPDSIGTPLP
jgi:hypothetical protein